MNVLGPGFSFDLRKMEPQRIATKPAPAVQRKTESQARLSPVRIGSSSQLPAVLTGVKSDVGASQKISASDETEETRTDPSVAESAAEQDEATDLSSDYEPMGERVEDHDAPDDQIEQQHQRKERLDALEMRYRSRFLVLDQLVDRLTITHNFMMQQTEGYSCEPTRRLGTADPTATLFEP